MQAVIDDRESDHEDQRLESNVDILKVEVNCTKKKIEKNYNEVERRFKINEWEELVKSWNL